MIERDAATANRRPGNVRCGDVSFLAAVFCCLLFVVHPVQTAAETDHEGHEHESESELLLEELMDVSTAPQAARRALFAARAQRDRGEIEEATATLANILEEGQDHYLVRYQLGNLLGGAGKNEEASKHLRAAVEAEPRLFYAWRNLGEVAYAMGKHSEAAEAFSEADERDPDHPPDALFYSAAAYLTAGKPRQALPACRELVSGAWDSAELDWYRAMVSASLAAGDPAQANAAMKRLVTLFPNEVEAWHLGYQQAVAVGDYLRAAAHLTVVGYLRSLDDAELRQLGDLYAAAGVPAGAAEQYAAICSRMATPSVSDWERLASSHLAAHDPDAALAVLETALRKMPTARLWSLKGEVLYRWEDYSAAQQAFSESARLEPENGRTHLMLGYCALELERHEEARRHLARAVIDPQQKGRAQAALAWLAENGEE